MEKNSEKMREVFEASIGEVLPVIKGKRQFTDTTKLAGTMISKFVSLVSAENNDGLLRFAIFKDLAKDKGELGKFISVAMPDYAPAKKELKK